MSAQAVFPENAGSEIERMIAQAMPTFLRLTDLLPDSVLFGIIVTFFLSGFKNDVPLMGSP